MLTNPKILHAHSVNLPSKSRFAVHKRAAVIPQSSRASNPRTQKLRDLLQEKYILKGPCCHDALSAKLIEQAGACVIYRCADNCAGLNVVRVNSLKSEGNMSRLGAPDTGLISYAEMVDQGRYIHEATHSMPIIGDGDTGYGNAVNVKRTVKGYAQAGFAGEHCIARGIVFRERRGAYCMQSKQKVAAISAGLSRRSPCLLSHKVMLGAVKARFGSHTLEVYQSAKDKSPSKMGEAAKEIKEYQDRVRGLGKEEKAICDLARMLRPGEMED
eukprot:1159938-Pelagomonas_calceolata.AAC.5